MDTDVELTLAPADTRRRWWPPGRRTWLLGAALLAVGATATAALTAARGQGTDEVAALSADDHEDTTTTSSRPSTTTTEVEVEITETTDTTVAAPVTTAPPPPTTAPRRTTTAAPPTTALPPPPPTTLPAHCRNSTDPVCGRFYWDPPQPPNQPLTIAWAGPTRWNIRDGGMPVRFQWSDADGWWMTGQLSIDGTTPPARRCPEDEGHGPWTPAEPPSTPHSGTGQLNPVYFPGPGTYTLVLTAGTLGCGWAGRSDATITVAIEVYEPPPVEETPPPEG